MKKEDTEGLGFLIVFCVFMAIFYWAFFGGAHVTQPLP